jgi:hypothetical protein
MTTTRHYRERAKRTAELTESRSRRELWKRYGVRVYGSAKRCPECGTMAKIRRPEGNVCWPCVMRTQA